MEVAWHAEKSIMEEFPSPLSLSLISPHQSTSHFWVFVKIQFIAHMCEKSQEDRGGERRREVRREGGVNKSLPWRHAAMGGWEKAKGEHREGLREKSEKGRGSYPSKDVRKHLWLLLSPPPISINTPEIVGGGGGNGGGSDVQWIVSLAYFPSFSSPTFQLVFDKRRGCME